jgi:hypothetical protein
MQNCSVKNEALCLCHIALLFTRNYIRGNHIEFVAIKFFVGFVVSIVHYDLYITFVKSTTHFFAKLNNLLIIVLLSFPVL